MNLLQLGEFTLHSGHKSKYKIDCDAFTDGDWDCIAFLLAERVRPFHKVVGVPRGGLKLAEKMQRYTNPGDVSLGTLIVDDVFTTGFSIDVLVEGLGLVHPTEWVGLLHSEVQAAVVFNRGSCRPVWLTTLFTLSYKERDV